MVKNKLRQVFPKKREEKTDDTVLFSFLYLHELSFTGKKVNSSFLQAFLIRLKKLSELGWSSISIDKRHGYGWEKIPISSIKPTIKITYNTQKGAILPLKHSPYLTVITQASYMIKVLTSRIREDAHIMS